MVIAWSSDEDDDDDDDDDEPTRKQGKGDYF